MRPIVVATTDASGGATFSNMARMDDWSTGQVDVQVVVTGTVNYTVQTSMDDPNSPTDPVAVASMTWSDSSIAGATATQGPVNLGFVPIFIRVKQSSGTGSTSTTIRQLGVTNR